MTKPQLYLIRTVKGDELFFTDPYAYVAYRWFEEEAMKEPVTLKFNWEVFLEYLLLGDEK